MANNTLQTAAYTPRGLQKIALRSRAWSSRRMEEVIFADDDNCASDQPIVTEKHSG